MLIYWNMELPLKATSSFGRVDSRPCKKRKGRGTQSLAGVEKIKGSATRPTTAREKESG